MPRRRRYPARALTCAPPHAPKRLPTTFWPCWPPRKDRAKLGRLGSFGVRSVLGCGGMGAVFEAFDDHLLRSVALKVMKPKVAKRPDARERFLREARSAAKIRHDNVVTIHQVGDENGIPFIAMDLLKGETLDHYLKEKGEISIELAVRIGREIAEGLQAAHAEGLIHRDIKPANIWLEMPKGRVKILDFGLARQEHGDSQLTESGAAVGTPAYMPPEQARGVADRRADLFGLGCVLYQMLTGQMPFAGKDALAVLASIMVETPVPAKERNPARAGGTLELDRSTFGERPRCETRECSGSSGVP